MTFERRDPIIDALAELTAPAPRAAREALVQARCHSAMTGRRHPASRTVQRVFDPLLPLAVVVYGVVIVVEGLRMAGLI